MFSTSSNSSTLIGFTPWPAEFAERYREEGLWIGTTFGHMLSESAARYGDRIAVVDLRKRWTYRQLDLDADRLATGFRHAGIERGDRVVVQLPNIGEFNVTCFALFRLGAIPVLAQPAHRAHEILHLCEQSQAVAYVIVDQRFGFDYRTLAEQALARCPTLRKVIVHGDAADHLPLENLFVNPESMPGPGPGDVALFQLSGGTTAVPKLIPRTHDDYFYSVRTSVTVCRLTEDDVYLCALPAAHNFPLSSPGILGALAAGATVVMSLSPSVDTAFPLIEQHGVTITAVVPPVALLWLEAAGATRYDLSSLRVLQVGGASFKQSAAGRVREVLSCQLQQVFGMAEGLVNYTRLDDPDEVVTGTQGRPMSPADEVRIVDDEDRPVPEGEPGHLLARGPYTIRGYYRADAHNTRAFTPDGFYRTGDIVRLLPTGNLVVEGRAKDVINRGGDKVSAEEVEAQLMHHPDVYDAALVAMQDDLLGERTCAFIILRGTAPKARELRKFLRGRDIADYKIPDRFEFVASFPLTPVGKVNKKELRDRIARQRAAEQGAS